jgi:hypothetical protein
MSGIPDVRCLRISAGYRAVFRSENGAGLPHRVPIGKRRRVIACMGPVRCVYQFNLLTYLLTINQSPLTYSLSLSEHIYPRLESLQRMQHRQIQQMCATQACNALCLCGGGGRRYRIIAPTPLHPPPTTHHPPPATHQPPLSSRPTIPQHPPLPTRHPPPTTHHLRLLRRNDFPLRA